MRLGFDDWMPVIYFAEFSTGKRISDEFSICVTKHESLREKIKMEAEKCRNKWTNMFHCGERIFFLDDRQLTLIIGKSLSEKIDYNSYLKLDNNDKAEFAKIISKIILVSQEHKFWLSSQPVIEDSSSRFGYIPMVHIHLSESMTKDDVNNLLEKELNNKESKLSKLGIRSRT